MHWEKTWFQWRYQGAGCHNHHTPTCETPHCAQKRAWPAEGSEDLPSQPQSKAASPGKNSPKMAEEMPNDFFTAHTGG